MFPLIGFSVPAWAVTLIGEKTELARSQRLFIQSAYCTVHVNNQYLSFQGLFSHLTRHLKECSKLLQKLKSPCLSQAFTFANLFVLVEDDSFSPPPAQVSVKKKAPTHPEWTDKTLRQALRIHRSLEIYYPAEMFLLTFNYKNSKFKENQISVNVNYKVFLDMRERINSVFFLVIGGLLLSGLGCLCEPTEGRGNIKEVGKLRSPHLIFIMVDDQGYGDIGYHGSDIKTPVLDQLATEGVKLENYYVQPICLPSRSQLMTGRYQIHTGLQHSVIRSRQPLCLPPDIPTLPERLVEAGYATHMVGKWHLGFSRPSCQPTGRGFQSFLGTLTGSGDHFSYQSCDGAEACGFDLHDGNRPAWEMRGNYSTLLYIERVKQILKSHNPATPLFLYLSLQAAHTPLQVPDSFLHYYDSQSNRHRRHYAAMLSCLDEGVAQVVRELKTNGLYQNSVLIYSSDNGGQPVSGGSNWPLRGGKGTYWEGGIRAVGFVHSPLLQRKGVVSRALIHVSDWYPTLLGLAGAMQSHSDLDGHDVWGSISEGLPSPRTEILFNIDPVSKKPGEPYDKALAVNGFGIWDTAVRAALRVGDWKLLTGNVGDGDWIPPQALPYGPERWQKLEKQLRKLGKSVWLFNISCDPYERSDLTEARPEVVKHLLTRLAEYNQTSVAARNPPDDPMADPELHGGVWSPWLGLETQWGDDEKDDGNKGRTLKIKRCKLCKLKALLKKVGSRLQRNTLF